MKLTPSKNKFLPVLATRVIGAAILVPLALLGIVWPAHSETPPILKESAKTMVGHRVSDFTLTDLEGRKVSLSDFGGKSVVVLFVMGKGCPVANLYVTELKKLQDAYDKKGLQIIGIDSNAGVTREELVEQAR